MHKGPHEVIKGWYKDGKKDMIDKSAGDADADGVEWEASESTINPVDAKVSDGLKGVVAELVTVVSVMSNGCAAYHVGNGSTDLFRYGLKGCDVDNLGHFDRCWTVATKRLAAELTEEIGVPCASGLRLHEGSWTLGHNNPEADGDIYHLVASRKNLQQTFFPQFYFQMYTRMLLGPNKFARRRIAEYCSTSYNVNNTAVERLADKEVKNRTDRLTCIKIALQQRLAQMRSG
jgi:hypothetical protein